MSSEESLKRINQMIGEHFSQFALVVIDYEDEMHFEWSSQHTAQSLFEKGAEHLLFEEDDEDSETWVDSD